MKTAIVIVVTILVVLVIVAGIIALIGSRLPKTHVASRSILLHQPRQNVYALVRDFKSAPGWRSDLKSVEVLETPGEKLRFREHGKDDQVTYELAEDVPDQRIVTRIVDTDLGYSGQWTYEFVDENGGTRVRITENGEVSNVFFRFMARYVFGHTSTIDSYLMALAKRFGETAHAAINASQCSASQPQRITNH